MSSSTKLALLLLFIITAGPLNLKKVYCLVFSYTMDEVLLSRALLRSIGLDLRSQLGEIREKFHDVDFATISAVGDSEKMEPPQSLQPPESLASLLNALPSGGDITESVSAPPYVPTTLSIQGDENPSETDASLRAAVEREINQGLPSQRIKDLSGLLKEYQDIFRSRMGPDPPAKVPAM